MHGLGYSNEIIEVIKRLLDIDPENRYSSGELLNHMRSNKLN